MFAKLEWDTNFFGINIARIECKNMNNSKFSDVIKSLREEGIQLVYCICHDQASETFASRMGQLVDSKVTYHKVFSNEHVSLSNDVIEEYIGEPSDKLYDLAIQSGLYSRFNIDSKLPKGKFEELYRTWILNSTLGKIAFKVLVTKENDRLTGMITMGEKNGRADIGLLAVDSNYRRKGIGKALISAAENEFRKLFKEGQVVTQKDNLPACNLYEKCGYTAEMVESIYHIWL